MLVIDAKTKSITYYAIRYAAWFLRFNRFHLNQDVSSNTDFHLFVGLLVRGSRFAICCYRLNVELNVD